MDAGLLNAVSAGLQSGTESYQRARASAEEAAIRRRQQQLALAQSGMQENESGAFELTPEAKEKKSLEKATTQAGILKSGYQAVKNPETGEFDLVPIPGFRDIDTEFKRAQINKLNRDTSIEKKGRIIPASDAEQISGSQSALKQLDDLNVLFGQAEDISGPMRGIVSKGQGFLQIGDTGKRAKSLEDTSKSTAQSIGKYLEGGKLTDADYERKYVPMLPNIRDTPDVRQNKINYLGRLIEAKNKGQVETLGAAGYDVSNIKYPEPRGLIDISKKESGSLIPEAQAADVVKPPKVGYVEAGYEFKGGDPSNKKNWKKVQ